MVGAGALGVSRRVDGQPETPADEKFFNLRESGYRGPIDQDGNIPAADDPMTKVLRDLQRAAERTGT